MDRAFDLAREGLTGELLANVESGVDLDLTDDKGNTLLLLAAYYSHPHTVTALVRAGAAVDRVNARGQTALAAAAFRGDVVSTRALLTAGADPLLGDPNAIETARFFEREEILSLLEEPPAP